MFATLVSFSCLASTQEPQAKPELLLQDGHSSTVSAVAFRPDEKVLATVGLDGILKLWDTSEHRELQSVDVREMLHEGIPNGRIRAVAYSPRGGSLALAMGHRLVIWNSTNPVIATNSTQINDLAFDPSGSWIGVASSDGCVRVLEGQKLQLHKTLCGHSGPVLALAVNPSGSRIVSGGVDKEVRIWDTESGKQLKLLRGHMDWIRVLAFSRDGTIIASGSDDKTIRLWSADSGNLLNTLSTDAEVQGLAFTGNGALVSGTNRGTLQLWDLDCGASRCRNADRPAPPGVQMVTVGGHSESLDYSLPNLRFIQEGAGRLVLSPSGRWLARGGNERAEIHEMPSLRMTAILGVHAVQFGVSRFSPDGRSIAVSNDESVRLWDPAVGRPKSDLFLPRFTIPNGSQPDPNHPLGQVFSLDFNPSGDVLAAGYSAWGVQLWNARNGRKLSSLVVPTDKGAVGDVRFSMDGRYLATCTENGNFWLWDSENGAPLHRLDIKQMAGNSWCTVAFARDNKFLATSFAGNEFIQRWDINSGRALSSVPAKGGLFGLTSNAQTGAFASYGNFGARLWRKDLNGEPRELVGHKAWVAPASFNCDGRLLATGSADNTVKIWDVQSGHEKQTLVGYPSSPSFSPDSRWLVSSGHGQTVLWDLDRGEKRATLISLGRNDWLVITPEGLFDGSRLAYRSIMWRFSRNNLFDVLPVESFFSEFYHPGLLSDIFNRVELPTPRQIASLDRRQPSLKFSFPGTSTTGPVSSRMIPLELDVQPALTQGIFTSSSGARDVRVFRNGSMIHTFHGEVGSSTLHLQVPIVAGPNVFLAYAFNDSNIKSVDAMFRVVGADSLQRKGTAYIVAMGVNQYANPGYNLRYAAQDAREFGQELKNKLSQLDTFRNVQVLPLIDSDATKANLLDALRKLGGAITVSDHAPDSIRTLPAAEPEDVVIVYFAGHGTSAKSHFYLIPHDLGYEGNRDQLNETSLNQILEHSVSDEELQTAFEYIDARQLVLIIDACNSGQALEAEEKRRGPMNAKGLAQLAYEKGMYVLTASQSYQAALEGEKLGHGLLTYALVEEGLKTPAAETDSHRGELELRDWLEYAAQRVPELKSDLDIQSRTLKHEHDNVGPELETSSQQPRLFYRQEPDETPLIIAKIPAR